MTRARCFDCGQDIATITEHNTTYIRRHSAIDSRFHRWCEGSGKRATTTELITETMNYARAVVAYLKQQATP